MQPEPVLHPLKVTDTRPIARAIYLYDLRDPQGGELPPFTAGAHVSLRVPNGELRKYSLCNDPVEHDRYVIAVKRDVTGRGGSRSLVDTVKPGHLLHVSEPKNDFALEPRAKSSLLIAGGIGITPIMSMVRQLQAADARYRLMYMTRAPEDTAFIDELAQPEFKGKVTIHHDGGDPAKAFDLWPLLERPTGGTHVYCCGPRTLMDAVRDMSGHWPGGSIHFESFGTTREPTWVDAPFRVRLQKSGRTIEVPAEQTLLEALRKAGVDVPSSCESGTCGTCKTVLLHGVAEHRDLVLGDHERDNRIMVCISRAVSPELVLDL